MSFHTLARVFPVGINVAEFTSAMQTEAVQNRLNELLEVYKGRKVILGVDRLDYIKVPTY